MRCFIIGDTVSDYLYQTHFELLPLVYAAVLRYMKRHPGSMVASTPTPTRWAPNLDTYTVSSSKASTDCILYAQP